MAADARRNFRILPLRALAKHDKENIRLYLLRNNRELTPSSICAVEAESVSTASDWVARRDLPLMRCVPRRD